MAIGISGYTLWLVRKIEKRRPPNYKDISCRYPDTDQQKVMIEMEFNKAKDLEKEIYNLKKLEREFLEDKVDKDRQK
jgi:hypothetical protein